jgi:hypothetical protein
MRGTVCIRGNLGCETALGMTGGILCVRGDVDRISNVFGGCIYVDGNIDELYNIYDKAGIICTGEIKTNIFKRELGTPSQSIYCRRAARNDVSYTLKEFNLLPSQYHYRLRIRALDPFPKIMIDPFDEPTELLPRLFLMLSKAYDNT